MLRKTQGASHALHLKGHGIFGIIIQSSKASLRVAPKRTLRPRVHFPRRDRLLTVVHLEHLEVRKTDLQLVLLDVLEPGCKLLSLKFNSVETGDTQAIFSKKAS